jgi:hypothetical protein
MTQHKNIGEAQLAVMRSVPYLQKRRGVDVPWSFAGEADLISKLRPAMIENGITVSPVKVEPLIAGAEFTTKSGSRAVNRVFLFTFRFLHVPSGTSDLVQTIGEASDHSDKAANKAMTIALKYALRHYFVIETGDDPDLVAINRHNPNAAILKSALAAIDKAKTKDELERIEQKIHSPGSKFTDEQKGELVLYLERKRKGLSSE